MQADAPQPQPEDSEPVVVRTSPDDRGNAPETGPRVSDYRMRETRSYKPPEPDLA